MTLKTVSGFMEYFLATLADKRWFRVFLPVSICAAVIAAYWQPLHLDLWNDEVYSLLYFQQVPVLTTLTDYHETNNHIFFNLLLNLYLRAIGSPSVLTVLKHPEIVRVVPLLFTLTTYAVLYRWIKKMLGIWCALLACVLLTATLPYYNFALQYRAYSLVMMLGALYLYAFWQYLHHTGKYRLLIIFSCSALIFYAHPAGIYLVLALAAGTGSAFLGSLQRHDGQRQSALYAACITLLGGIAGGIMYMPVLGQLLANPWVSGHRISIQDFLRDKFLSSSFQLICSRYWLLILAVAGTVLCVRAVKKGSEAARPRLRWLIFCAIVYLVTFIIPMLRHDDAPQRTFTILIPFLVAGIVIALDALGRAFATGKYHHTILLCISIIMLAEIPVQIARRNRKADELAMAGKENVSLINGYFLHHFHPMNMALLAQKMSKARGLPVYCGSAYRQEMPHYLEAVGLLWKEYRTPAQRVAAPDSCYIITSYPERFIAQYGSGLQCSLVNTAPSFYYLLFVIRRQ